MESCGRYLWRNEPVRKRVICSQPWPISSDKQLAVPPDDGGENHKLRKTSGVFAGKGRRRQDEDKQVSVQTF